MRKAEENIEMHQNYAKERYDANRQRAPNLCNGDLIFVRNEARKPHTCIKLTKTFTRPYKVLGKSSDNVVEIERGNKRDLVSIDRINPEKRTRTSGQCIKTTNDFVY